MFENTLKEALIRTYVETFGRDAWTEKTEEQKESVLPTYNKYRIVLL